VRTIERSGKRREKRGKMEGEEEEGGLEEGEGGGWRKQASSDSCYYSFQGYYKGILN
jgi:hypothetical protein